MLATMVMGAITVVVNVVLHDPTQPDGWLALVGTLIRGELSGTYPYDSLDAADHGYPSVLAFAAGIILAMLTLGSLFLALDHVRSGTRRATRAQV